MRKNDYRKSNLFRFRERVNLCPILTRKRVLGRDTHWMGLRWDLEHMADFGSIKKNPQKKNETNETAVNNFMQTSFRFN